jgi:hypothetical protein
MMARVTAREGPLLTLVRLPTGEVDRLAFLFWAMVEEDLMGRAEEKKDGSEGERIQAGRAEGTRD